MFKQLRNRFKNIRLRKKFIYIVSLCVLIIANVAVFCINAVSNYSKKELYKSVAATLSYSAAEISASLGNLNTMADMFLGDSAVQSNSSILKCSDDAAGYTKAYQNLYSIVNDYYYNFHKNNIQYMAFYQNNTIIKATTLNNISLSDDLTSSLIEAAVKNNGKTYWITNYGNSEGLFVVKEIRRTNLSRLDYLGVLIVDISIDELIKESASFTSNYEDMFYILYHGNDIIYNSKNLQENANEIINKVSGDYGLVKIDKHAYFAVKGIIPNYEWGYICLVSYDTVTNALTFSRNICFLVVILSIIVAVILSSTLVDSITKHLGYLIQKMQSFGNNITVVSQHYPDYSSRSDEIGILHQQFDKMTNAVNELIEQNFVKELLVKDAELRALENQINPHFLYNTLTSIIWRANAIGETQISEMVDSLGKMMRITLTLSDDGFTIARELELINSYMTIQSFRYEERLKYRIDIPTEYKNVVISKLCIQPLIENSIHYALEENIEVCFITVAARTIDAQLIIKIANTGSQFENNLLERLRSGEVKPHGHGIGLLNIDNRLKLQFGAKYGLHLYNSDNLAIVEINIPYDKEDTDVKTYNS